MSRPFLPGLLALTLTLALLPLHAEDVDRRPQYLAELQRLLPRSAPWEAWLASSRELPPDFATLTPSAPLPDPLRCIDGRPVASPADWPARRTEILDLFQHYVIGSVPPPPGNVRVRAHHARSEPDAEIEELTLEFGPEHRASLRLELLRPAGPGPFPVFLTQFNHRRWALIAVSRGYLAVVYAGADARDDTGPWTELWPSHDWTKLTRRAWAASRCLDYLKTRPEADLRRVALTGHSRNGKTALIAAALDQRIAAVISSSSGAGGACPWRCFSEAHFGEGIELITRNFPDWLHPRLRFFVGRENLLPFDQHQLLACIAPRAVLLSTALNDNVESVWAIEQAQQAAQPVFDLLGAPQHLNLRYRPGPHATHAEDIESYLDWLDWKFGRSPHPVADAPLYPTYSDWLSAGGTPLDPQHFPPRGLESPLLLPDGSLLTSPAEWESRRHDLQQRIELLLGTPPPHASDPGGAYGAEPQPVASLLRRDAVPPRLIKESLSFGNYVAGDLYYPTNIAGTRRQLPAFIWLHPLSVSHGYVAGYHRGESPHLALTRSGYAVFAFDQIGHGARLAEARHFYRRYPQWSLLGKSIADTRAAVDALQHHPHVDPQQIYLTGYGTGAWIALHAAASDPRVAGAIVVAGVTPWRLDTAPSLTGGVARWSRALPWIPRLGAFVGEEARIPYDLHELLALIAPRPVQIITPGLDYQASLDALQLAVRSARQVFELLGAPQSLVFQRTASYHHFSPELVWCLCDVETLP